MIDRLEWIREQVEDLQDLTWVEADAEAVSEAAASFREQLPEVEGRLFDLNCPGPGKMPSAGRCGSTDATRRWGAT